MMTDAQREADENYVMDFHTGEIRPVSEAFKPWLDAMEVLKAAIAAEEQRDDE